MAVSTIDTYFCRKARHVRNLQYSAEARPVRVEVVKIIQLTQEQYQHFSTHLLEDMPFIKANRGLTNLDRQGVNHCLLVTTQNIQGGILVDSQGYDYARYTAEVTDKSVLDLRDVPVDHYDLKLREPRDRRDR